VCVGKRSRTGTDRWTGDLNPLGDGPCRSLASNGARVPKILPVTELEGFLNGLIVAMPPELVGGAAVGDDVEARRGGARWWR
jgi:hypothetical protein